MSVADVLSEARRALEAVRAPAGEGDIVGRGLIKDLSVSPQGVAKAVIDSTDSEILAAAKTALEAVAGVARAVVVGRPGAGLHANPLSLRPAPRIEPAAQDALAEVKKVVAVASGKGGVGKSTTAANLAVALAARGLAVGLLDADVYGPSLPTLFGLRERPAMRDSKIVPARAFGIAAMSIGLLVDPGKALAWRGPMVMGAVRQLIGDVLWGPLDILVVDTPPGTGDVHLSLIQSKRLDGAIVVSTPQEMALADARRGIELFRTAGVPVIGVIENMAYLETAGGRIFLFGEGGAERVARESGVPFLGALPIFPELRAASDAGAPIAVKAPDSPAARAFDALAAAVADKLGLGGGD